MCFCQGRDRKCLTALDQWRGTLTHILQQTEIVAILVLIFDSLWRCDRGSRQRGSELVWAEGLTAGCAWPGWGGGWQMGCDPETQWNANSHVRALEIASLEGEPGWPWLAQQCKQRSGSEWERSHKLAGWQSAGGRGRGAGCAGVPQQQGSRGKEI